MLLSTTGISMLQVEYKDYRLQDWRCQQKSQGRVDIEPADPEDVGHVWVDRWFNIGSVDGFNILSLVFGINDSLGMLQAYLVEETRYAYRLLKEQHEQQCVDAGFQLVDTGRNMVEDAAQFMVDCIQVAMIYCQEDKAKPIHVTLLVPRIDRKSVV